MGSSSSSSSGSSQSSGSSISNFQNQQMYLSLQAPLFFVDLVIDSVNSNKITSPSYQFSNSMINQTFNITSGGSGFIVQMATVINVVSGALILSASAGTVSSTGGHGNIPLAPCLGNTFGMYQGTAGMSIDGNNYRYLGSTLTNSSNQFYNSTWNIIGNSGRVYYEGYTTSSPFTPFGGVASNTGLIVSLSSIVPPSSQLALVNAYASRGPDIGYISIGKSNGDHPSRSNQGTLTLYGPYANWQYLYYEFPLDYYQSFIAATQEDSALIGLTLSLLGYFENR